MDHKKIPVKYDPFEQYTQNGELIEIKLTEDSESDRPSYPWIIARFDAFVNGEHAGYLKCSFIPPVVNRYYGGIWWALGQSGCFFGKNVVDYCIENNCRAYDLPMGAWRDILTRAIEGVERKNFKPVVSAEEISKASEKELRRMRVLIKKQLMGIPAFGRFYRERVCFHGKDSAFVDYSRTFGPSDYIHYGANVQPANKLDDHKNSYRGQGVGFALYQAAAYYYGEEYGVKLRASGIQSDYAKYLWKRMRELDHPQLSQVKIWNSYDNKYRIYDALDYSILHDEPEV